MAKINDFNQQYVSFQVIKFSMKKEICIRFIDSLALKIPARAS